MTISVGSFAKKAFVAAMTAVVIAVSLVATTGSASARPYWKRGCYGCGWGYGGWGYGGWGYGGAGLVAGLALGAIAASAYPAYVGQCYYTRREVVDGYGNVYLRRIRVCD
jgi:hypothetical protein